MTWTYGSPGVDGDLTFLLWMQGSAGAGKSAIQQTIAERGAKEGILAASFFFSHQDPDRDNPGKLVPTLAYQLATKIPDSAEVQMEALILEPIARATEASPRAIETWPKLIVIDGLDECKQGFPRITPTTDSLGEGLEQLTSPRHTNPPPVSNDDNGEKHQLSILTCLHHGVTSRRLPFRVVLASRPDQPMRAYFSPEDPTRTSGSTLARPSRQFRKRHGLPLTWATQAVINTLAERSSGQFIYASTVIRFVTGSRSASRPQETLEFILNTNGGSGTGSGDPFLPLDAMYRAIFKSCLDPRESILCLKLALQLRRNSNQTYYRFTARDLDAFRNSTRLMLEQFLATSIRSSQSRTGVKSVQHHMTSITNLSWTLWMSPLAAARNFGFPVSTFQRKSASNCFALRGRSRGVFCLQPAQT
ncbi:hypothetical protein FA15DRAFT_760380 [Coprinopsis marcescibilis]|uniref:Nephrocystin 3-like N-terminal domain-containing protein n=1 Tax=Coprinopsis marcescibilis TaxID=230819 RepID=A0A5C3KFI3_COPMA|nr:hypothetical protein FA15DRAFT_760380 [Coprinopsis marcescibilis]